MITSQISTIMKAPEVQVMLVSEQAAPNLLAALDSALKPQKAVLLASSIMQNRALTLQKVLKENGIDSQIVPLPDEHNLAILETTLLEVAANFEGSTIALNVTGGNKLMALAAYSVAQASDWPTFYVDVDTDQIIWLDKNHPAQSLSQELRLNHYLRSYGYNLTNGVERPQPNAAWQKLLSNLVLNVETLSDSIGQLNYISQQARHSLTCNMTDRQMDSRSLEAVLRNFEDAKILKVKDNNVTFQSEAARFFANGGWIEHHVYQTVCKVTGAIGIRDKAANLQVQSIDGQPNEIDVAFMARNRLFMIECKTARMDNPEDLKANDTLYKLAENCRRIGGLGTKGLLATYRQLKDSEYRLAKALHIEVIAGANLKRLDEKLKQWVRP
jgi:hypothetical protein